MKPSTCDLHAKGGGIDSTRTTMCPSLQVDWHEDPPQEVGALLLNLLHDAPALIVILPRLTVALRQLRHRPRVELVTLQQLRPRPLDRP